MGSTRVVFLNYAKISTALKSYLKLIRDVAVCTHPIYVHSRKRAGMPRVTSDCDGTTQRKLPRDGDRKRRERLAFDNRFDIVHESTRKSSASDRPGAKNIRLYSLNWEYFGTYGKGFGRYRSWGSIELRKVYAKGTWRVSQSSESLRHGITREASSSSSSTLLGRLAR